MRYLTHDAVAEQAGITLETMPMANQNWALQTPSRLVIDVTLSW